MDGVVVRLIGLILLLQFSQCFSFAQDMVQNLGFEKGNFDGWVGYEWRESGAHDVPVNFDTSPTRVDLPTARRHVIISDRSANDPNTGYALKMIPPGYKYSARLGCETINRDPNPRCWQQSLRYKMTVDNSNAFLLLKFALVLEGATHDNTTEKNPHFQLSLYDQNNDPIDDCSNYDVVVCDSMESTFNTYYRNDYRYVRWRDWTEVGADLSAYIGQDITIEFLAADCTGHYHFGYAYFVVDCMPLYIQVDYCSNDSEAILEAPEGFAKYQWLEADNKTEIGTRQNLLISNPTEGAVYYCAMESETGCSVSLSAKVARFEPQADFSAQIINCTSKEVRFINESIHTNGTLQYLWDFGDGSSSVQKDPIYSFPTSGSHNVGLILLNPPSGCSDTLYREVESFSKSLVGIEGDSVYCPGSEIELQAFGGTSYEWSTGETSSGISVGAPGGDFWMLARSSTGCVSDTLSMHVSEDGDWDYFWSGDSIICAGNAITLSAGGALNYRWNTGETSSAIEVTSGGIYEVSGINDHGCIKQLAINVLEIERPDFEFSLDPPVINSRNNLVECKARSKKELSYQWDMGDGSTESGSLFSHSYGLTSELLSFPVEVIAVDEFGCSSLKTALVSVEPFVPNVFTPNNGDNKNNIFMEGYQIKVFDRNGIVLYEGDEGWDGDYNGRRADPDTYFYQLGYTDVDGLEHNKRGFITLVR